MVELVDHLLEFLLQDHEIHDHPILTDVALESEAYDVGVAVEPGALLVSGYEMACGEPDPRIASVYLKKHESVLRESHRESDGIPVIGFGA